MIEQIEQTPPAIYRIADTAYSALLAQNATDLAKASKPFSLPEYMPYVPLDDLLIDHPAFHWEEGPEPPQVPGSGGGRMEQSFARLANLRQATPKPILRRPFTTSLTPPNESVESIDTTDPRLIHTEARIPPVSLKGELQEVIPARVTDESREASIDLPEDGLNRNVSEVPAKERKQRQGAEIGVSTQTMSLPQVELRENKWKTQQAGIETPQDTHLVELKPSVRHTRRVESLKAIPEARLLEPLPPTVISHIELRAHLPQSSSSGVTLEAIKRPISFQQSEGFIPNIDEKEKKSKKLRVVEVKKRYENRSASLPQGLLSRWIESISTKRKALARKTAGIQAGSYGNRDTLGEVKSSRTINTQVSAQIQ